MTADPVETISYDTASRVIGLTLGGHSAVAADQSFGYDALNRLIGYSDDNNTLSYSYDANGNRSSQTLNQVQTGYTIDPGSNRLLAATNAQLFAALNPASYGYDPQGTRAWRIDSSDTRYFVYDDGKRLLGEYLSSGSPVQETVYLNDLPVAVIKNGTAYYVHADYRNTPRQIDNAAGQAVWTWTPLPFGDMDENVDPMGLSTSFSYALRYPGQYYDSDSQTFYNVARFYDPQIGRYLESDPIGLDGSLNTYTYADSDPIDYFDPLGLSPRGGERGQSGGSSGIGTDNPYKHCKEDPNDPKKIICKDNQTGKKITKPKPADWGKYNKRECEACKETATVVVVAGTAYVVYRCLRMAPSILIPPLWPTIPLNAAVP